MSEDKSQGFDALAALALWLPASMFWALVVRDCWNWHLCALFPSAPHLTFWRACGISILWDLLMGTRGVNYDSDASPTGRVLGGMALAAILWGLANVLRGLAA